SGFSERVLENLLYDLQKLHGITDVEKVSVQMAVVSEQSEEDTEGAKWELLHPDIAELFKSILRMTPEHRNEWGVVRQKQFGDFDSLLQLSFKTQLEEVSDSLTKVWEYMSTHVYSDENKNAEGVLQLDPNSEVEGINLSTEPIDTNTEAVHTTTEPLVNDDAVNALVQENQNLVSENEDLQFEKEELEEENEGLKDELEILKSLPKIDAKSIRVEFPFLNDKNCPDEFKILIADKITAWNSYLEFQDKIKKAESGEEPQSNEVLEILAKEAIQSFDENQKIYDELNAYQTTGKVLGLHPIFKKLQLTREVEEMTADELVKYKGSSAKYFSVNKTAFAKAVKAKDTVKQEEINSRVTEREQKLDLVNKKLGINPK
ncbi:MAG: hypothetical protein V4683_19120, partial [Bacteroidota bacterium]